MILAFAFAVLAHEIALGEIQLKQVRSNQWITFDLLSQDRPLTFFFGKNCPHCLLQARELNCLNSHGVESIVIMRVSNEEEAYREKIKLKLKDKVYLSHKKLQTALQNLQIKSSITPTLIFPFKKKLRVVYGMRKCNDILESLGKERTDQRNS